MYCKWHDFHAQTWKFHSFSQTINDVNSLPTKKHSNNSVWQGIWGSGMINRVIEDLGQQDDQPCLSKEFYLKNLCSTKNGTNFIQHSTSTTCTNCTHCSSSRKECNKLWQTPANPWSTKSISISIYARTKSSKISLVMQESIEAQDTKIDEETLGRCRVTMTRGMTHWPCQMETPSDAKQSQFGLHSLRLWTADSRSTKTPLCTLTHCLDLVTTSSSSRQWTQEAQRPHFGHWPIVLLQLRFYDIHFPIWTLKPLLVVLFALVPSLGVGRGLLLAFCLF